MKNLKMLLIPIGFIALMVGIFAFTNPKDGGDKKCKVKIVKIVNGVRTEIDSTFDCSEDMNWVSEIHSAVDGDSLHKMIKVMMMDGDSGDFNFNFNFNIDESDEDGMKVMKFTGDDGKEMEMKFDFQDMDGEDGKMKMIINGKEIEITADQIEKHLEKLGERMQMMNDKSGNVEIMIEKKEDGKEPNTVKIIKKVDEDGNVTMKKVVDGEEMEMDDEDMKKMHGKHHMMFVGKDGESSANEDVTVDVKVDMEDGKETKHIVIITKVTNDNKDEVAKKVPEVKQELDKKELAINKLKFSPNPNEGKFDLSFKLDSKSPVSIKIFDLQGKEVYNEQVTDFSGKYNNNIDITDKGEGVYILQIVQNDKASTSKIVIK